MATVHPIVQTTGNWLILVVMVMGLEWYKCT